MLMAGMLGKGSYEIPRKGMLVADALGTVACGAEAQFTVPNNYISIKLVYSVHKLLFI